MTQNNTIRLTGLDAQDPLAYLASLGCLLAVATHCARNDLPAPRLYFDSGAIPILESPIADADALIEVLMADLDEIAGRTGTPRDPFLRFSYLDDKGGAVQDLKPRPDLFRIAAQPWIDESSRSERRTVDWAAAVLTDVAIDRSAKGGAKPFALHFTAGQQRFLNVANELLDGSDGKPATPGVHVEDLRAAVFGPWPTNRTLKVFSWSPTQDRPYALRAEDPASDKKLGNPGADWLALRGIGLLSSAPEGKSIVTGGVRGGWKSGTFSYPLWTKPLDVDAVSSLLRHPAVRGDEQVRGSEARTMPRGVEVLTCRISRSDQGGYGAFSRPSRRGRTET